MASEIQAQINQINTTLLALVETTARTTEQIKSCSDSIDRLETQIDQMHRHLLGEKSKNAAWFRRVGFYFALAIIGALGGSAGTKIVESVVAPPTSAPAATP